MLNRTSFNNTNWKYEAICTTAYAVGQVLPSNVSEDRIFPTVLYDHVMKDTSQMYTVHTRSRKKVAVKHNYAPPGLCVNKNPYLILP